MDKLIFLDIDGVVNTLMIDTKPYSNEGLGSKSREGFYFDLCDITDDRVSNQQAVMWLNKLCKETNAKIVISSCWRRFERDGHTTERCLRETGLLPEIEVIGKTPYLCNKQRGDEISAYLRSNYKNKDYKFVILDDDSDMGDLMNHLVLCSTDYGFNYPEYVKALKILEN